MWRTWLSLALVCCARAEVTGVGSLGGEGGPTTAPPAPRTPPRTLDRQAAELAWRAWLQSPESRDPGAPPRRITTKSLFITPLVCPKGQRLDRDGCVQVVIVNKEEHERYLLEQLNALFTSAPGTDDLYDYGDSSEDEPGPLQLSIPLAIEPEAASLQGLPNIQGQETQPNYVKIDKPNTFDASIEAELELLKLQSSQYINDTILPDKTSPVSHSVLNNFLQVPDKPKRDSPDSNQTIESSNTTDKGQKEVIYGHVDVDPVLYGTDNNPEESKNMTQVIKLNKTSNQPINLTINIAIENPSTEPPVTNINTTTNTNTTTNDVKNESVLKKATEDTKLNPETEYSNIGEAIKLISRYADVTTDDNFTKDNKETTGEGILGTRTKLQHRRNKIKPPIYSPKPLLTKVDSFYRNPWPPQGYPFRHIQDYWRGRPNVEGLYHENPRRHHHSYPYMSRKHMYAEPYDLRVKTEGQFPRNPYPAHKLSQRQTVNSPRTNNRDLYTLLGLRHWFSTKGIAKR